MIMNSPNVRNLKEAVVTYCEVLSQHFLADTDKDHEKL
jgi:hypothetical protein